MEQFMPEHVMPDSIKGFLHIEKGGSGEFTRVKAFVDSLRVIEKLVSGGPFGPEARLVIIKEVNGLKMGVNSIFDHPFQSLA